MTLTFPFPLPGSENRQQEKNNSILGFLSLSQPTTEIKKPFYHLPSSLSGVRALIKSLPETFTDINESDSTIDWENWVKHGGLQSASKAWIATDDMANWQGARSLPRVFMHGIKNWTFEDSDEKNTMLALMNHFSEKQIMEKLIGTVAGSEPDVIYASTYEEWYGYDPKGGAINREDWWKGGGREGEAESKEYHQWEKTMTTLPRTVPLFLQIMLHIIQNRTFAIQFTKAYDESYNLIQSSSTLARYGINEFQLNEKVEINSPRGQIIRSLLTNDSSSAGFKKKNDEDPLIQNQIKTIAQASVASQFGGDPRAIEWYDILADLKQSSEPRKYHFPSSIKAPKRAMIHEQAEKMGLKHYSEGIHTNSQEGKKLKKRAEKKGLPFVERHVVVKNF